MKSKILGLLAVGLLAGPMTANAALLNFSLADATDTFVFQLDSSPTPTGQSGGPLFANIAVSVNGTASLFTVNFKTPGVDGGLDIFSGNSFLLGQVGPQLFTGTSAAPMFATGVWALSDYVGPDEYNGNYTLTVSAAVSAVPEPGSLALLGLGLLGLGMSRRKA